MSRLLVVTRPELAAGFMLAGAETFAVEDVETAQALIGEWLEDGESGLLAVDDGLLASMDSAFVRRMEAAEDLPFLAIPGVEPPEKGAFVRQRISELTRRVVGFHSIFKSEETEKDRPGNG
jgi:vacuolar-type H+-ATPase subunit F/Vma7